MTRIKKALIVANFRKSRVVSIIKALQAILGEKKIESCVTSPIYFKLKDKNLLTDLDSHFRFRSYDIIIALGGDGTFLFTARTFHLFRIPILGINAGRVGFLMEVKPSGIKTAIEKAMNGELEVKEKIIVETAVIRKGKRVFVCPFLNDSVVSKGVLSRMVELTVCLDQEILSKYRSDGLIVSTPTGSTAYSLAAGGPILTQDLDAMILTPICPHILGVRPIVTDASKELRIILDAGEEDTTLTIDGQENFYLKIGDILVFKKFSEGVRVYDLGQKQFFSILREKLGWHI